MYLVLYVKDCFLFSCLCILMKKYFTGQLILYFVIVFHWKNDVLIKDFF